MPASRALRASHLASSRDEVFTKRFERLKNENARAQWRLEVEIVLLLPGKLASRLRRQAAELLCKFLGGDVSLIDQMISNRRLQDDLAKNAPADPRRAFGEMVEQEPGMSIQRALEQALPPRLEQQLLLLEKLGSQLGAGRLRAAQAALQHVQLVPGR